MSDTTDAKPVVLTVTIYPPKNGKRAVLITGAPEGEMPEVRHGLFADRHRLLDDVFTVLLKRKPQVVKVKPPAERGDMTHQERARMIARVAGSGSDDENATNLVASGDGLPEADAPAPPAELPEIEGDDQRQQLINQLVSEAEGDTPETEGAAVSDQLALPLLDAAEAQAETEVNNG